MGSLSDPEDDEEGRNGDAISQYITSMTQSMGDPNGGSSSLSPASHSAAEERAELQAAGHTNFPAKYRAILERVVRGSSEVEGPIVDPTYGDDRTAEQRDMERRAAAAKLLGDVAGNLEYQPIFVSEYLLIVPPPKDDCDFTLCDQENCEQNERTASRGSGVAYTKPVLCRVMKSGGDMYGYMNNVHINILCAQYEPDEAGPGTDASYFCPFKPSINPGSSQLCLATCPRWTAARAGSNDLSLKY